MRNMKAQVSLIALAAAALAGCATAGTEQASMASSAPEMNAAQSFGQSAQPTGSLANSMVSTASEQAAPTVAEAEAFVQKAEKELMEIAVPNARAQWVNATYITEDTNELAA